jgi:hypothetical protein
MQEAERIQTEIQKVIGEDPTIKNADRIVISVEKKGLFKGEIVLLKGKVHSDLDKVKIERIATLHAAGRKVVDDIVVVH